MPQDRAQYLHEYYEAHKEGRNVKLKEKRQVAWDTFATLTTNQPCAHCGVDTGPNTLWRHRETARDTKDSRQNLADIRYAARMGYNPRTLRERLNDLLPLCPACFAQYNPSAPDRATAEQLAPHQKYEQSRDKKTKAQAKSYRDIRVAERLEWLASYLNQPCAYCGNTYRITWHYPEREFDNVDQHRNLSHVRSLCKKGASMLRIQKALTDLKPMCPPCYKNPAMRLRRLAEGRTYAFQTPTSPRTSDTGDAGGAE